DNRAELAYSHFNLGNQMFKKDQWAQAEANFRQSISLLETLVREVPTVPSSYYSYMLARNHGMLGLVLRRTDRRTEAAAEYGMAIDGLQKVTRKNPDVLEYALDLGGNLCNFGLLLETGGKLTEALDCYGQAIQTLTQLAERFPQNSQAREYLRNSHYNRAEVLTELKRFAEAMPDWDRGIALDDSE